MSSGVYVGKSPPSLWIGALMALLKFGCLDSQIPAREIWSL